MDKVSKNVIALSKRKKKEEKKFEDVPLKTDEWQFASVPMRDKSPINDTFDRLSSHYTVIMLTLLAGGISLRIYVGEAITCWAPKHLTKNHIAYANSYCWVKNTHYVPFDENIPKPDEERDHIPYYQWVPFILLIQAVLFYLPSAFWETFSEKGYFCYNMVLTYARAHSRSKDLEDRNGLLNSISKLLHRVKPPVGKRFGNNHVILYLFSKILYMANVLGQLYLLNSVLSTRYTFYGYEVLKHMLSQNDWTASPDVAFPLVTYCDFIVRRLGNNHRYTLQCTLPANMYNEKIFTFLWFWLVFLAIVTALGIMVWTVRAISCGDQKRFIMNHLRLGGKLRNSDDEQDLSSFMKTRLAPDGLFHLRLVAHNTSSVNVTEIISHLWDQHKKSLQPRENVAKTQTNETNETRSEYNEPCLEYQHQLVYA